MEDTAIVDLYWQRSDRGHIGNGSQVWQVLPFNSFNFVRNNEDAEECVNDTWFRAWNLMPDKRPSILSTFLGGITRNLAISVYRRETSQKRGGSEMPVALDEMSECVPSDADLEQDYEIKEFEEAIGMFVAALPEIRTKRCLLPVIGILLQYLRSQNGCTSPKEKQKACCSVSETSCVFTCDRKDYVRFQFLD